MKNKFDKAINNIKRSDFFKSEILNELFPLIILLIHRRAYTAQKIPMTFGPPPCMPPNLPDVNGFKLPLLLETQPSIVPGSCS